AAERKDVLCALFFVLTLWAYAAYARRPVSWRYARVVACFALALLAKPMAVTLPLVLILMDLWPLRRARLRLVEKLPLIAMSAASTVVTFVVQQQAGAVKAFAALPLSARTANALVAYLAYIGKAIWPAHLAPIYPYRPLPEWQVAGAAAVLAAV